MNSIIKGLAGKTLALLALSTLAACSGGGSGGSFAVTDGGGNTVNGFDLSTAQLIIDGPDTIGTGSRRNYSVTLLDGNGIPPVSPPGVPIELFVSSGSTNPPDGDNTDVNGTVDFQYRAPTNGTEVIIRARVRNEDDEIILNEGRTVTVLENIFQFAAPPEDTQIRLNEARALQFDWRIGNTGATTGTQSQGNPSAIRFSLAGRPAGGGFRVGGSGAPQDPVVVNIVNGELAQDLSVVAGDAGGAVTIVASATTDGQNLNAELPVEFVGQPTRIDPTPTNIRVPLNGAELLEVRVFDENGTPLSEIPLTFEISICIDGQRNTAVCNGSGEEITRTQRTTDSEGLATTGFVAGNNAGGGEIEITVQSGPGAGLQRAVVYNVGSQTP